MNKDLMFWWIKIKYHYIAQLEIKFALPKMHLSNKNVNWNFVLLEAYFILPLFYLLKTNINFKITLYIFILNKNILLFNLK